MSESHEIKGIIGDNTPVTICFDYEPPQREIRAPNERAQPAEDAQITVGAVLIGNDDIGDWLNAKAMEKVEDQCWQFMSLHLGLAEAS